MLFACEIEDSVVFLCLDLSISLPSAEKDPEYHVKMGELEIRKLEGLLLLFSLCQVLLWCSQSSAPRLDTEALKLLAKVQEFQAEEVRFLSRACGRFTVAWRVRTRRHW